jgi:cell division protein FtsB
MGFFKNIRVKRWFKFITNTYVLILIFFVIWMLLFDSNSYLIHKELNEDIDALEQNKEFYQNEIRKDQEFIKKLSDSFELEKFAREKYYLKRDSEDIYIIEVEDSVKKDE